MGLQQSLAPPGSGSLSQLWLSRPASHRFNEPPIDGALSQVSAPVAAGCELMTNRRARTLPHGPRSCELAVDAAQRVSCFKIEGASAPKMSDE